jgi:N-acetylneuraminic acid mutarotase
MMKNLFWEKYTGGGRCPPSREGHSFNYSSALKLWLMFGGVGTQRSNEVYCYDPSSQSWKNMRTTGSTPNERCYHLTWVDDINHKLFMHGGQNVKRDALKDFFVLDLHRMEWTKKFNIKSPTGRVHAAGCKTFNTFYLYGGSSSDVPLCNDLWIFPYTQIDWSRPDPRWPDWCQVRLTGEVPSGRKGHTICIAEDRLIVFGGITADSYTSDLYLIETGSYACHFLHATGTGPNPRAYHNATLLNSKYMAVFGGVESRKKGVAERVFILNDLYLLDIDSYNWTVPFLGGMCPTPRYGSAMDWGLSSAGKGQLLLVGGLEQSYCGMEVYALVETDVGSSAQWSQQPVEPKTRQRLSSADSTLMDHKKRIIELEEHVYDARDYVATMQKDNQDAVVAFKTQREQNQRQLAKLSAALDQSIHRVEEQNAELGTYGRAAEMLKTKHSLLDKRADHLEEMVKKAESLLITMDLSYNEVLALSES